MAPVDNEQEVRLVVRDELKSFLDNEFPGKLASALRDLPEIKFIVKLKFILIGAVAAAMLILPTTGIWKLLGVVSSL